MAMPRKQDEEKYCQACGKRLHRKRYNGTLESNLAFRRRKYCSQLCMAAALTKDEPTLAGLRRRAIKFRGKICQECGTTKNVGVHHLNGDPADNSDGNLMTLCGSCHTRWHWNHGKKPWKQRSICKICGQPARRSDMCQKHYQRFKLYGDPLLTKKKRGSVYVLVRETPGAQSGPEFPESPEESKTE